MPTERYDMRYTAKLIAMFVRDGIEDFHCEHLTDERMCLLNLLSVMLSTQRSMQWSMSSMIDAVIGSLKKSTRDLGILGRA